MNIEGTNPKAFFPASDGKIYPDYLICTVTIPAELNGKPCPHSQAGFFPDLKILDPAESDYSIDKGKPGDLCPTCAKQQLPNLGH
jgi:hypothetical protein